MELGSQMNQNHISDQDIEIMRQLEELREDVRALLTMRREDAEALREDIRALLTMRRDVEALLTIREDVRGLLTILSRNLQDHWAVAPGEHG